MFCYGFWKKFVDYPHNDTTQLWSIEPWKYGSPLEHLVLLSLGWKSFQAIFQKVSIHKYFKVKIRFLFVFNVIFYCRLLDTDFKSTGIEISGKHGHDKLSKCPNLGWTLPTAGWNCFVTSTSLKGTIHLKFKCFLFL